MEILTTLVGMLVGAAICGWACYIMAERKKRDRKLWAVAGVLLGLFAVIALAILPSLPG